MSFDLSKYLCPPAGRPMLLSTGENCQSVQCADGWVEFRKNHLVEELYVTDTVIGRGADTSELYTPDLQYHGKFYIQYERRLDGKLYYGAPWAKRYMNEGEIFHRTCTIKTFDFAGNLLKQDNDISSDLKFVKYHPGLTVPSGITVPDVIELQWGGGERYFYANGLGLVQFQATNGSVSSYVVSWSASPVAPQPHPIVRPVIIQKESPMPTLYPALPGASDSRWKAVKATNSVFARLRSTPVVIATNVIDVINEKDLVSVIDDKAMLWTDGEASTTYWIPVKLNLTNVIGWARNDAFQYEPVVPPAPTPAPVPPPAPVLDLEPVLTSLQAALKANGDERVALENAIALLKGAKLPDAGATFSS